MDQHVVRHGDNQPGPAGCSYVLVVDDEPLVRTFLARCLESGGYVVKQSATATEALEIMARDPALVVLCDVRMPDHDGLWLTERLCTRWPDTRVVMATGIDDLEVIRQSRELGAVDYITKPILPQQLLKVVLRAATASHDEKPLAEETVPVLEQLPPLEEGNMEAEYALESPVRCPGCGERITTVRAIRLIRAQVNFTSTLPRRGRVIACPLCLVLVPAELSNL
jgi:CheY-like chemotaxis protein